MALCLWSQMTTCASASPAETSAQRLADAIEHRADRTSFADLERFGEAAGRASGPEALRRLQHVSVVLMNQSDFNRFEHWNGILEAKALREGDRRYRAMAEINELMSRYERGDSSVRARISSLADTDTDWFVKVYAISTKATILVQEDQAGAALKLLFDAENLIPAGAPEAAGAESEIWEGIGVALMQVNDLEGSAEAFQKAEFDFSDKTYPRPDFDGVYNMAHLALRLGDAALARDLAAIHHRLAARSGLPELAAWDRELCGMVAESFGTPQQVMQCLKGLDERLTGAEFLAPRLLPMRAVAAARQGDLSLARADYDRLRTLRASHAFSDSWFGREPEVAAELLAAEGRNREALALLRAYADRRAQEQAQQFSAGVHQVTAELASQLQSVKHQADLEGDVLRFQRWVGALASLLVALAGAALIWQRKVSRRLREAQQKAELASRSKSEFLANMSHEIRTPLNGVVGVADMLAAANLPERERRMAEIIRSSGQSLERLLSDVLDLAKVEAGQLTIEEAPFHAGDLVRAVAALSSVKAEEKGLALREEIMAGADGWFMGDAVRVRQILTNLASNAVKFTAHGAVTIRAEAPRDGVLRFSVTDTGVGFDAEQKKRLFGRFQQADGSITRRFGGTGLGLAISRQLAHLMGGAMNCDSEPGRGSSFWFEAPFTPVEAPAQALEDRDATAPTDRAVRILVADDHATNLLVVRMMLDHFGYESAEVGDGAQAVEAFTQGGFDVVLMDMQMPVMGGLEATRLIREHEAATGQPRTPILMLSANALAEHREACEAAGADGHVAKPVTVAALLTALNAVLERGGEEAAEGTVPAGPRSAEARLAASA